MVEQKTPSSVRSLNERLQALGIDAINRSTHPMACASSWDHAGRGMQLLDKKADYRYPHIYPQSILVTAIGNLWEKHCWSRLQDMMLHTAMAGYSISIQEMLDGSIFSSDAIGLMRWSASMMARDAGVEWLFMVDNDVLLNKDTLVRLLEHDRPVVFPLLNDLEQRYPVEVAPLSAPVYLAPNTGLTPVRWSAMSVMLFNVKIFNVLDSHAWWGTDYHFGQALNYTGHRIYVDTDTVVDVVRGPSRHSAKEYEEFWDGHRKLSDRIHHEERDRRPPPGFNPLKDDGWVDPNGCYFAVPNKSKETNGAMDKVLDLDLQRQAEGNASVFGGFSGPFGGE